MDVDPDSGLCAHCLGTAALASRRGREFGDLSNSSSCLPRCTMSAKGHDSTENLFLGAYMRSAQIEVDAGKLRVNLI